MLLWLIIIGGFGTLFLAFMAFQGPSASKAVKRRIELIKERHGDVITGNARRRSASSSPSGQASSRVMLQA
jgi:tight adherence protein B